MFQLHRYR